MDGLEVIVFLALVVATYFLPTIIVKQRTDKFPYTTPIFVLNLLTGWTIIGWVIALVWAVMPYEKKG